MSFNYSELKGKIVSEYGNQANFSKALGVSASRVSKVLTGKAFLYPPEIVKWCSVLRIAIAEIPRYFFTI